MKKIKSLFLVSSLACFSAVSAMNVSKVEPSFWWSDMKNNELQVMLYGKDIDRKSVV